MYCAVMLDVCSRRVVGWAIDSSSTAALTTNVLGMAIDDREPSPGTMIHSEHGVQGRRNWSSQHLDHEGVRWDASTSRYLRCLRERDGSGRRIGRCDLRCAHRAALSPLVRCSGTSGGGSRRA